MNELITKLGDAGLVADGSIVLDAYGTGEERCVLISVSVEDFARMFGEAAETGYEGLIAADDNGDGTTKGYKRFFDVWRAAGII